MTITSIIEINTRYQSDIEGLEEFTFDSIETAQEVEKSIETAINKIWKHDFKLGDIAYGFIDGLVREFVVVDEIIYYDDDYSNIKWTKSNKILVEVVNSGTHHLYYGNVFSGNNHISNLKKDWRELVDFNMGS